METKNRTLTSDEMVAEKDFIQDVLLVGLELGKAPTKSDYENSGIFNSQIGIKQFGC